MSYDGFEIDMLNVGDADCILVTRWEGKSPIHVLIDGGNAGSFPTLKRFLESQGIYCIDHVVCSHPHDDHAGGIVQLLKEPVFFIGTVWMHIPERHVNLLAVEFALNRSRGMKRAEVIQESLATADSIIDLCERRDIEIKEPFQDEVIDCLTVVGPTQGYYEELVAQFADSSKIQASEEVRKQCVISDLVDDLLEAKSAGSSQSLLTSPETPPENNSSVILATVQQDRKCLFTADAGAQALTLAAELYDLASCHWMQIPHHGSRRNITEALIQEFAPKVAFVSATGSKKHPRRAVVNAFKKQGSKVYSTHYPFSASKWQHWGNVPERPRYVAATPLWEANK